MASPRPRDSINVSAGLSESSLSICCDAGPNRVETLAPGNPLGVKGAGEAGGIPLAALFAQAMEDALGIEGLELLEIPLSPNRLFEIVRAAET